jgi:hypothetical protein
MKNGLGKNPKNKAEWSDKGQEYGPLSYFLMGRFGSK